MKKAGFWIFTFWIIGVLSSQELEDYEDWELMPPDVYEINNHEILHLNNVYCLNDISASLTRHNFNKNDHKSLYYIKITWKSQNNMMSIRLESDSIYDPYCNAKNKHYYNRKPLNQSFHIFPDDVNEGIRFFPIKLDCKYIITPELEGICKPVKLKYKTPVCIDNQTCSCRNVFIPIPNLEVDVSKGGLYIFWSIPKNFLGEISKFIIIIYQEDGINVKKVAKKIIMFKNFNSILGEKYKEHLKINITNGNNYKIESYFENRMSCHGNSSFIRFQNLEFWERKSKEKIISFALAIIFLFLLIVVSLMFFWKKHTNKICLKLFSSESLELADVKYCEKNNQRNFLLPKMVNNMFYSDRANDSYWFDYRQLIIIREIGKGNFGVVFLATAAKPLKGCKEFAVKQMQEKATSEDLADFNEEIKTFKLVGNHPNVVKMLGYCGAPYPMTIIMEYVPFNLLKYLKNLRLKFERNKIQCESFIRYAELSHSRSSNTIDYDYISQSDVNLVIITNTVSSQETEIDCVLDNRDLEIFGLQIAKGMAHLESKGIIHRDLAARNVLMDAKKNLKISDFGMSRTGIYVNKTTRKFPLRWMSPEALINRVYSNKSDVWSFGVVLWEIATLGAFPHSKLQNEEVVAFLKKGGYLEKPENVTNQLYAVMEACWAYLPDDRPTFENLVGTLEKFCRTSNGYVDFECLKTNYAFPPLEEEVKIQRQKGNTQ